MGKHPSQSEWRALRRIAISGQKDEVRSMLLQMQKNYPNDPEVEAEIKRLETGTPLHVVESKKQRTERLMSEAQQGIASMLESCGTVRALSCSHTPDLQAMQRQLHAHIRRLKSGHKPAPQGTRVFARMLKKELKKRKEKNTRSRVIHLAIVAVIVLLLVTVVLVLRSRAGGLAHQLRDAQNAADWNKTAELLLATDTGINRLVHKDVVSAATDARKWQQRVQATSKELTRQMLVYENLEAVSSLSVEERGSFLRQIRALPAPFSTRLLAQWDELCRPVRAILEKQKREVIARFEQLLPLPELVGDPAKDGPALQETEKRLTRLQNDFRDAQDAFGLDQSIIAAQRDNYARVCSLLKDIDQLSHAARLLSTARNYAEHRRALEGFSPVSYPVAVRAADILPALGKQEEALYARIRSMKHRVPDAVPTPYPAYVIKAVTENGPTFGPKFPANVTQLGLMEDLFTSRTMRTKLYELISVDGQVNYTEERPEVVEGNKLRFRVSNFDPRYKPGDERKVWLYAQAVKMRLVDVTDLLKVTDIRRSTFFSRANVPDLLGRVTQVHTAACPALAKAYVYDILQRLIEGQENQPVFGLRFSPTLKADMLSFRKLKQTLGVEPRMNAWLEPTADHARAEEAFAKWFEDHSDRHYEREMGRNLRAILSDRPQYLGYVDEFSHPRYKETQSPTPGKKIYYFSSGRLIASPVGEPLRTPAPFSPLFVD